MIANDKNRDNDNYPLKNKVLNRVITQKTSAETDKLNPNGIKENSNNHTSAINKLEPDQDILSSQNLMLNKKLKNKRYDRYGNPIIKKGKQRVTFIDKMTPNNFVNVIKIESYKEYNKMEEVSSSNRQNNCCLIE